MGVDRVRGEQATALEALLAYIEAERRRQRDALLTAARQEARDLEAQARRNARARVREAVARERRKREAHLQRAHTQLRAQRNAHRQALLQARLERARERLEAALTRRWGDPRARHLWLHLALRTALLHLRPGTWVLYHPRALDAAELRREQRVLTRLRSGVELQLRPDSRVSTGIRLRQGAATLDATGEALLARAPWILGLLRAAMERPGHAPRPGGLER